MKIEFTASGIRRTSWRDYTVRFLFGGGLTVLTGVIADRYGPGIGGLFLAFPAILPASLTLVARHERERKAEAGMNGVVRGGRAAALDAFGATVGCTGLLVFAILVWQLLPASHHPVLTLLTATCAWGAIAYLVWRVRER